VQTVPAAAKNEDVYLIEDYLGAMVRGVDSSLLDEWEKLRDPSYVAAEKEDPIEAAKAAEDFDITRDAKTFEIMIRNEAFRFVRALAVGDAEEATTMLANEDPKAAEETIGAQVKPYFDEHARIQTDTKARSPVHLRITKVDAGTWEIEQTLVDPEEHNDWSVRFSLDLARARTERKPVLRFESVGPIGR
jgi:hypothetical protein